MIFFLMFTFLFIKNQNDFNFIDNFIKIILYVIRIVYQIELKMKEFIINIKTF